jgi:hypothetical protein
VEWDDVSTQGDSTWRLLRYHHVDGRSKDWAYRRLTDGGLEVCWGRTGQVRRHCRYPAQDGTAVLRRAAEKQGKAYVPLGEAELHDGAFVPIDAPRVAVRPTTHPMPKATPCRLDLSRIAAGEDDFWF